MTQPLDSDDLLTGDQKKRLRGLGHHLEPVVYIGREGLSPALVKSSDVRLRFCRESGGKKSCATG